MKLLFDQNLSPRLVELLSDLFPGSDHVQNLGLDQGSDARLWDFARDHGFAIVTKDVDFSDRSAVAGPPPKILWLRLGNCTTDDIESAIRSRHEQIGIFNENDDFGVLALFR